MNVHGEVLRGPYEREWLPTYAYIPKREPRIGSLFTGYGGLDMGVQSVLGGTVAWHVEFDDAPSKILAHHWPDVPNHGDITQLDFTTVEPVDILTGGFPCQDLSLAGRRAGMRPGTRSGLWADYLRAIDTLRPKLAVIENVRGLLSGCAESDLEPCPGCVGDGEHRPVLRALGRVLGDLAGIGYDAEWIGIRAADAGAPHGRFRVIVVAHPNDDGSEWTGRARDGWDGLENDGLASADSSSARRAEGEDRRTGRGDASAGAWGSEPERVGGELAVADAEYATCGRYAGESPEEETGAGRGNGSRPGTRVRTGADWGPYRAAIERWEPIVGRRAPAPTRPTGRDGGHRLNPEFVEWMMGLPAGHVTADEIGLSRAEQLKALGNGVVPQQAALALSLMEVAA